MCLAFSRESLKNLSGSLCPEAMTRDLKVPHPEHVPIMFISFQQELPPGGFEGTVLIGVCDSWDAHYSRNQMNNKLGATYYTAPLYCIYDNYMNHVNGRLAHKALHPLKLPSCRKAEQEKEEAAAEEKRKDEESQHEVS